MTIKVNEINPLKLPSLPLVKRSQLPKKSGIYFAIDSQGTVQYIGRSANFRHRWINHHKYDELKNIGNIKIAYLFIDTIESLPEIEIALIKWFQPPLNKIVSFHIVNKTTQTSDTPNKTKTVNSDKEVICHLKSLMNYKKVTQLELSVKTGLATSTIGRYYRNKVTRIEIDTVETLMKYFDLKSINQLIEVKPN